MFTFTRTSLGLQFTISVGSVQFSTILDQYSLAWLKAAVAKAEI